MERRVEAGDLRQAGNAWANARAPRTLNVWCDGSIRVSDIEVVEPTSSVNPHGAYNDAAEHHTVAGRHHLRVGQIGFPARR